LGTNTKSTNLRIYESTKIDAHKEKYFNSIMRSGPRRLHINTDGMDSVEDYDRQWEKRQIYLLRDMQIRDNIPNVTFIFKGHIIEEHRSYLYAKKSLKMSKG